MKTILVTLAVLAGMAYAGYAQAPLANCLPGVTPGIPLFSLSSTIGVVGDYTLSCTNTGFLGAPVASLNFDFFMNVSEINTGSWTLTQGPNTYPGSLLLSNTVQFLSVAYDPNQPTLSFEIHGVEVNPSLWGPLFVYEETSAIAGSLSVNISNPIEVVAFNGDAPEPATLWLTGLAAASILAKHRRGRLPLHPEEM